MDSSENVVVWVCGWGTHTVSQLIVFGTKVLSRSFEYTRTVQAFSALVIKIIIIKDLKILKNN